MGGDSTAVQSQLRNVREMHSTHGAFAAILEQMEALQRGDTENLPATALQSRTSSKMHVKFMPLVLPLLPFWQVET